MGPGSPSAHGRILRVRTPGAWHDHPVKLGRRRHDPNEAFWAWWVDARPGIEAAIADGSLGDHVEEVSRQVQAIHPDLEWEFAPGTSSAHVLCVTAAGRRELRSVAERWRLAGPPPDARWSYASARPPAVGREGTILNLGPVQLAYDEVRFGTSPGEDGSGLDVVVHHPAFASIDVDAARQVAFLALDWTLGEDDVERWIGSIDVTVTPPDPLLDTEQLRDEVRALRAAHLEPQFMVAQMMLGPSRVILTMQRPLKRVEYPLFDTHGRIEWTYGSPDANDGMPDPEANEVLSQLTDELEGRGGDHVLFAVRGTGAGARFFEVMVDGEGDGRQRVDDVLDQHRWGEARVEWNPDPGWEGLSRYGLG